METLSNQYFLAAVAAVCVVTVYLAFVLLFRRNAMQIRTQRMVSGAKAEDADAENRRSAVAQALETMLSGLGVNMEKARQELYAPLGRAGISSPDAVVYLKFFQMVIQPVCVLIGVYLLYDGLTGPAVGLQKIGVLLPGLIMGVIGAYGTRIFLTNARQKRENRLKRSFPDALDLLLICVESGLSLDTALVKVCNELRSAHPEMTDELDRTRMELNVLNDRTKALQNLADRTNTSGFRSLVASLLQSEKFGTSLADTLRVLADEFRINRLLYAENKAARIPALITIPLIFFILPAFMLIIMGPPMIKIKQQGGLFGDNK